MARKLTKVQILERLRHKHGYRYEYEIGPIDNLHSKIKIICKQHGQSDIIIWDHLSGSICKECSNENRRNLQKIGNTEFIKRALQRHGSEKYDYSRIDYINNRTKITIRCIEHNHFFNQLPTQHLNGNISCPNCGKVKSLGEKKVREVLNTIGLQFIEQYSFSDCRSKNILKFDFYLTHHNMVIEYDGKQHMARGWNSEIEYQRLLLNDSIKNKYCLDNRIKLIRIPYTQFGDIEKIIRSNIPIKAYPKP